MKGIALHPVQGGEVIEEIRYVLGLGISAALVNRGVNYTHNFTS